MLTSSCATIGPGTNGCDWVKPIYVSKDDRLTEGTKVQILNHDKKWKELCGKK